MFTNNKQFKSYFQVQLQEDLLKCETGRRNLRIIMLLKKQAVFTFLKEKLLCVHSVQLMYFCFFIILFRFNVSLTVVFLFHNLMCSTVLHSGVTTKITKLITS